MTESKRCGWTIRRAQLGWSTNLDALDARGLWLQSESRGLKLGNLQGRGGRTKLDSYIEASIDNWNKTISSVKEGNIINTVEDNSAS